MTTAAAARETRGRARPGVLVAAGVVAASIGVLLLTGGTPTETAPPTSTPAASAAASPSPPAPSVAPSAVGTQPAPASPTTSVSSPPSPAVPVAAPDGSEQGWDAAATGFAAAFTAEPGPGQDWAGGLAPWVSADLATAYAGTDASRRPTGQLVEVLADSEDPDLVVATVSYDSGLRLALELRPSPEARAGWVVHTALPVPT